MSRFHVLFVAALVCFACGQPTASIEPGGGQELSIDGAMAPDLTRLATNDLALTILERTEVGHRLTLRMFDQRAPVREIAEGNDFFANWADVSGLVEAGDGSLTAHWLQKSGTEVYDYGIRLARSTDSGETWADLGWLNDDAWEREGGAPGEHGFVAWVPEGDGARAFWLDGRAAGGHDAEHAGGAMQLRTTTVVDGEVAPSEVLDDRICDCCPTAAVMTSSGPLVAFRDRTADEIRDIHLLRRTAAGWQRTAIDTSGWQIAGCPVNGPALAADGDLVLAAWYSAHPEPRVYAAWSHDGGGSFGDPHILTADTLGRVTATIHEGTGYVAWLSVLSADNDAPLGEIRMVAMRPGSPAGAETVLATTAASRRAGVPRLGVDGDGLVLAWTEVASEVDGEVSTQVKVRRWLPGL